MRSFWLVNEKRLKRPETGSTPSQSTAARDEEILPGDLSAPQSAVPVERSDASAPESAAPAERFAPAPAQRDEPVNFLRFTAHAIDIRHQDRLPVPYALQFTHGESPTLSLKIDYTVDGIAYHQEVRDVVAVAFYPVALRANSPFADEYVMSLWQRVAGVAAPQIVDDFEFYSIYAANPRWYELSPIRPYFLRPYNLRFTEPQIRAAVIEERWARFDWHSVRIANGGYVLATPAFAIAPAPAPTPADDAVAEPEDDATADISALLESATLNDDQKYDIKKNWECGICLLGLEGGSHLVSAHPVSADSGGRHRLHVFHSHCLRNWQATNSSCSQLCPTCKLPLDRRPLPAAWSPTTRLSAPQSAVSVKRSDASDGVAEDVAEGVAVPRDGIESAPMASEDTARDFTDLFL